MNDQDKSKEQLLCELMELRLRVSELEANTGSGQVHDDLERRVEERTRDLQRANERLQREIEERQWAEQELAIFKRFAEASGVGVGMADMDGQITYVNPAMCRIAGEDSPQNMLDKHFSAYCPKQYRNQMEHEVLPAVMAQGQWRGESGVLTCRGCVIPTLENAFLICDEHGQPLRLALTVVDLTERRQAQEALQASEERFWVTFEEAPVGMAVGTKNGVIVRVNRALSRMIALDAEEFRGHSYRDFTHPDDLQASDERLQGLLDGEFPSYTLQKRYLKRGGGFFWSQATVAGIKDARGKVAFLVAIVEDITERIRAQETLRRSERRFRNYFEQGLIGMAVTSVDQGWLEVNDRLCETLGYSRAELLHRSWPELTHPEDLESDLVWFDRLLAGEIEHYTLDKRFLRKDGSIVYTTIYVRAFRKDDRTVDHVVALIEDITSRKQAQEALRQSHDELQAIYDEMLDGILIVDIETATLVRANLAAGQMLGYSEEEMPTVKVSQVHPPEAMPEIREHLDAVAQGRIARSENTPFLRRNGTLFFADVVSRRILYNKRWCRISFLHDVTERRRAQAALERERRTLEHLLQASDHERQLIAYDIHDGLAQELAGAIMHFQIYEHQKGTTPENAQKAFNTGTALLRQAHGEARRLISGVRPPILDESGVVPAVSHLVHDPAFIQGPQIDFWSKITRSRLAPVLENVTYRIVQEGLSNARKHSKSPRILVSLLQRSDRLRIEIRDWGVGFTPKTVKQNCFGLEGIRERARILRGKCRIKSRPGEGTSIVVILPIVKRGRNNSQLVDHGS